MSEKSLYEILNVKKDATQAEITKQYKALLKKYHPDKAKTDEQSSEYEKISAEITEAYQIISDVEKRKIYDEIGTKDNIDEIKKNGGMPPFGSPFGSQFGGIPPEIAAMMGMGRKPQQMMQFQPDIIINVQGTLENIYNGIQITKEVTRVIITVDQNGTSKKEEKDSISVIFPPGTANGKQIKIPGKGNKLIKGRTAQAGSIIVILREEPHNLYKRSVPRPLDLYMYQQISIFQALLGEFKLNITEVTGHRSSIILDDTVIRPNTALKIKNKGMINNNGVRGDLYIIFNIDFPKTLTQDKRKALKKMANYVSEAQGQKYDQVDIEELQELLNSAEDSEETTYNRSQCVHQ